MIPSGRKSLKPSAASAASSAGSSLWSRVSYRSAKLADLRYVEMATLCVASGGRAALNHKKKKT